MLSQKLEAAYYQPLNPPRRVTPATWSTLRMERAATQKCVLEQIATVAQTPKGFRLRIQATVQRRSDFDRDQSARRREA